MKKKRKNNRYYIDSHFLLKVLLDIYSSEKSRRLQFYETALSGLENQVKNGVKNISFNNQLTKIFFTFLYKPNNDAIQQ